MIWLIGILVAVAALLFAPIHEAMKFGAAWPMYSAAPDNERGVPLAPFFLPLPTGPPNEAEAEPLAADQDIFINGLLVRNSQYGLMQTDEGTPPAIGDVALNGVKYGTHSLADYMRVSGFASNPTFQLAGIARDAAGSILYLDCSGGLPANVQWVAGLPVTDTGQLCIARVA